MIRDKRYPYPYDAIRHMMKERFGETQKFYELEKEFGEGRLTPSQKVGFDEAFSMLDEKSQKIFLLYWKERKSLREVGKEMGCSIEGTRRNLKKTFDFLAYSQFDLIRYGEKEIEKRRAKERLENTPTIFLSARSFHALKSAGINTVGELFGMKEEDFGNIKSLGKGSVIEILVKISSFSKKYGKELENYFNSPLKMEGN